MVGERLRRGGEALPLESFDRSLKDMTEPSPQSGDMFIATDCSDASPQKTKCRISLFAEQVRRPCASINITCLRHVSVSIRSSEDFWRHRSETGSVLGLDFARLGCFA
jgi:hypothetical protein